jgi:hypothetical protein
MRGVRRGELPGRRQAARVLSLPRRQVRRGAPAGAGLAFVLWGSVAALLMPQRAPPRPPPLHAPTAPRQLLLAGTPTRALGRAQGAMQGEQPAGWLKPSPDHLRLSATSFHVVWVVWDVRVHPFFHSSQPYALNCTAPWAHTPPPREPRRFPHARTRPVPRGLHLLSAASPHVPDQPVHSLRDKAVRQVVNCAGVGGRCHRDWPAEQCQRGCGPACTGAWPEWQTAQSAAALHRRDGRPGPSERRCTFAAPGAPGACRQRRLTGRPRSGIAHPSPSAGAADGHRSRVAGGAPQRWHLCAWRCCCPAARWRTAPGRADRALTCGGLGLPPSAQHEKLIEASYIKKDRPTL